jgi:hypothetical protein
MYRFFAILIAVGAMSLVANHAMAQHHHHHGGGHYNRGGGTVISVGFGNGGGFTYGNGISNFGGVRYGGFGYGVPAYGYSVGYARPVYNYYPAPIVYPSYGYGGYYGGGFGRPGCGGGSGIYLGW